MEWSSTSLRTVRAVAESGSFSAAAEALGYTQSAVSRQIAAVETAAGARLFERSASGARVTDAGQRLLAAAAAALDVVDAATTALGRTPAERPTVRLGAFPSIAGVLLPAAVRRTRDHVSHIDIVTREAPTPSLVRSLRAGTLDLAVIGAQPPYSSSDDFDPPLRRELLLEGELLVALPTGSRLGSDGEITVAELATLSWVSGAQNDRDGGFGAWPALPSAPTIAHRARDWLTRLALVGAGAGATTVPPYLADVLPTSVRLVHVSDGAPVVRRAYLGFAPHAASPEVERIASEVLELAGELSLA